MTESFIHYLWQFQYFDKADLKTTSGETVEIFFPGTRNSDAGPDFLNARVRIGSMEWIGSVEIHIEASSWISHKHQHDDAYENVILHVVWSNDQTIHRADGSDIPTLELKGRVGEELTEKYKTLVHSIDEIACASVLNSVDKLIVHNTIDRMMTTRLEAKAREVLQIVKRNRGDWQETAYQILARNFGFKINGQPFLQLAQALPLKTLMKHGDKLGQIEAMMFGVAGFLDEADNDNDYYMLLQREFNLLRQKYRLDHKLMNKSQWKFLRLRPANFPTLRVAQLASFIVAQPNFFSRILELSLREMKQAFSVQPSQYWCNHYNFSARSTFNENALGESSIENIIINTVAPLFTAYAMANDDQQLIDKATDFLQDLHPETNKIIVKWTDLQIDVRSAFDSQGLLELHNNFCVRHRCLDCNIGASLVKPAGT